MTNTEYDAVRESENIISIKIGTKYKLAKKNKKQASSFFKSGKLYAKTTAFREFFSSHWQSLM